ncbi:hypothetical protein DFH09DRAFT_1291788 [Mycena vulgaris]|nr:hypothetical protein DFH09DRAFT_1291788 [Mycena vulgaris]
MYAAEVLGGGSHVRNLDTFMGTVRRRSPSLSPSAPPVRVHEVNSPVDKHRSAAPHTSMDPPPTSDSHAPAASVNLKQCVPSSASPKTITMVLDEIRALDFSTGDRVRIIENVDFATWTELQERKVEGLHHRFEYLPPVVIVTCASGVHEGFLPFVQPLSDIVQAMTGFSWETNRDVPIDTVNGRGVRVPDYAITQLVKGLTTYRFMVECAWSQRKSDVLSKAEAWMKLPAVSAVLCIVMDQGTASPDQPTPLSPGAIIKLADQVVPAGRARLSDVTYAGKTWARGITKITLYLYQKNYETEVWNVTPSNTVRAPELQKIQNDAEFCIAAVLHEIFGDKYFDYFSEGRKFGVRWEEFYDALDQRLRDDAYEKYFTWAEANGGERPAVLAGAPILEEKRAPKKRSRNDGIADLLHESLKRSRVE